MPPGAHTFTWIFVAAGSLALLAGTVYPVLSVIRTSRGQPRVWRWVWALSTTLPGLVCLAMMPGRQLVGLALNWIIWLAFLWRARALTWRVARPWSTGILAAIAVLAAGFVGHALWTQHDSTERMPLTGDQKASS